jgi:hypothetical protein
MPVIALLRPLAASFVVAGSLAAGWVTRRHQLRGRHVRDRRLGGG